MITLTSANTITSANTRLLLQSYNNYQTSSNARAWPALQGTGVTQRSTLATRHPACLVKQIADYYYHKNASK